MEVAADPKAELAELAKDGMALFFPVISHLFILIALFCCPSVSRSVLLTLSSLCPVSSSAEMPLDALVKQYAGAYADNFDWPQPSPQSDEEDREETEGAAKLCK